MQAEADFFELLALGGEYIGKLEAAIMADKRRQMHEVTSDRHPLNKKNNNNMSPLYVACLHGNYHAVALLLSFHADPKVLNCI